MELYVRSAGMSIRQDYSWIDENGKKADIDPSVLSCNLGQVKFIWKSTGTEIFIFGNSFIDRSRVDLSKRPLRNYILLKGSIDEAEQMFFCFANMLLKQKSFELMLNSSVQNTSEESVTGFEVNFANIRDFLAADPIDVESRPIRRYLCEKDSYEARKKLLHEICSVLQKKTPFTFVVGGELPISRLKEATPDRALLSNIDEETYCKPAHKDFNMDTDTKVVVGITATLIALVLMVLSRRKKS